MGRYDPRRGFDSPAIRRDRAQDQERMRLEQEGWQLLDLIAAEFASDPMSVQCFDQRVVARAIAAVGDRKTLELAGGAFPILTNRGVG